MHTLKDTIGRIPLFKQTCDPFFQLEVFPLFKPLSATPREIIFTRGEISHGLFECAAVSPACGRMRRAGMCNSGRRHCARGSSTHRTPAHAHARIRLHHASRRLWLPFR